MSPRRNGYHGDINSKGCWSRFRDIPLFVSNIYRQFYLASFFGAEGTETNSCARVLRFDEWDGPQPRQYAHIAAIKYFVQTGIAPPGKRTYKSSLYNLSPRQVEVPETSRHGRK